MESTALQQSIRSLRKRAKRLASSSETERNQLLHLIGEGLRRDWETIKVANERDIAQAKESGQKEALIKRLVFNEEKLHASLLGLEQVASLPDPIGTIKQRRELDEGLLLEQIAVPIGVIGMIFEARPDALIQIVSLCLKSGNGIILKGGKEAFQTNSALVASIQKSCKDSSLGSAWLLLLESHSDVDTMLRMEGDIDLLIPRGSNAFVRYVMDHTSIPVLGHADGICHLYLDAKADISKAIEIAFDSKTQYPAACNAIETLLVHKQIAPDVLPLLAERFSEAGVIIHGDEQVCKIIDCIPYQEGDWKKEYLALEINIHVVESLSEAINHIETYGSHHSDAIVSEDSDSVRKFFTEVDSADVFANCSTRFADGFRFGLGSEVGISTAKIHARGPVGLEGLMTTKYLVMGTGQVVSSYTKDGGRSFLHHDLPLDKPSLLGNEVL
ncbi:glutamate-5-semialdehyde dehydrogenase [Sphaerochaeta halotolerans]|jgi:glutamate-5-semialdehyde dehydrogenase|uniref:Gamma-glutamyl phosphate reductase n=1 Tax=Sphaerochaeta halotolerans TaxID=2293840 RepID=A0A372MI16_9SPIR|nr:glutamate-5-semialdehyde dehydrogenase [Sphaerochaeta halotolerans]RFU95421.1 glutamate-5-semialdehyde dehydrogenase [Sphaerochaeta halotolerans]